MEWEWVEGVGIADSRLGIAGWGGVGLRRRAGVCQNGTWLCFAPTVCGVVWWGLACGDAVDPCSRVAGVGALRWVSENAVLERIAVHSDAI